MSDAKQKFEYISDEPDYRHLTDRARYKALYEEVGMAEVNEVIEWREDWMKFFNPRPNSHILELGSHNGPNLLHYARQGHTMTGVELSEALIATFKQAVAKEPAEVQARMTIIQGWIEEFQPQQQYDYVLVTEVLEHVIDPIEILKKAEQSVKIGGEVYISSPATHWGNNTHVRGVPLKDLESWLAAANLQASKMHGDPNGWSFCHAHTKRKLISF